MISVKNIDLLCIKLLEEDVYYNSELLIIKTPILKAINISNEDLNLIEIDIEGFTKSHNRLKEVLLFINRKYKECNLFKENNILVNIDSNSAFFDSNKTRITKNSLNKVSRIICSLFIKGGNIYLHQCMKI